MRWAFWWSEKFTYVLCAWCCIPDTVAQGSNYLKFIAEHQVRRVPIGSGEPSLCNMHGDDGFGKYGRHIERSRGYQNRMRNNVKDMLLDCQRSLG